MNGPTYYVPSGPRGGGNCQHCERPKRTHFGKHLSCPVIVIYHVRKEAA